LKKLCLKIWPTHPCITHKIIHKYIYMYSWKCADHTLRHGIPGCATGITDILHTFHPPTLPPTHFYAWSSAFRSSRFCMRSRSLGRTKWHTVSCSCSLYIIVIRFSSRWNINISLSVVSICVKARSVFRWWISCVRCVCVCVFWMGMYYRECVCVCHRKKDF